jgi:argininosuccinate lyase
MAKILEGGRLQKRRDDVLKFTSSINDDARLLNTILDINKAHTVMLIEQGIVNASSGKKILEALNKLEHMQLSSTAEDVHMAVEEAVIENVGIDVGGSLHVAKSRNDQVATAIRMVLREQMLDLMLTLTQLQDSLLNQAEAHASTIILEYTHLQPAQPVTFGHYLLSHVEAFNRDTARLRDAYERINTCPLGACALATTSFPINRDRTATLLGFARAMGNSIDAVGSRDFILEVVAAVTLIAINLSRFAEDLIIWSTPDFNVIELPDEFASTSSIMPQKKNPEVLEVIRARAGHVLGNFASVTAIMKGLPSTYNLDFQEITPKLWDSIERVKASLQMCMLLVPNVKVKDGVSEKASRSFVAATELANMLVRKHSLPFRTAHRVVGALVKNLVDSKKTLQDVTPQLLQEIARDYAGVIISVTLEDIASAIDIHRIVESYNVKGGPAPAEVQSAVRAWRNIIAQTKTDINQLEEKLKESRKNLEASVKTHIKAHECENRRLKKLNP